MIEPDVREMLFWDINNMLGIEPDFVPHYFSTLIDKLKVLISGQENHPMPVCQKCGSTDVIETEEGYLCLGNSIIDYDIEDNEMVLKKVKKMNRFENHIVKEELILPYINKITGQILNKLKEPDGYIMNLYVLEGYLFREDSDSFFETERGDVRKAEVMMDLSKIKRAVNTYVTIIRPYIRFSASLKTPPIKVG